VEPAAVEVVTQVVREALEPLDITLPHHLLI
jgi:hypothetical protein